MTTVSISCVALHPTLSIAAVGTAAPDSNIFEIDLEASGATVFAQTKFTQGSSHLVRQTRSSAFSQVGPSLFLGSAVTHVMYWNNYSDNKTTGSGSSKGGKRGMEELENDTSALHGEGTVTAVPLLRRVIVAVNMAKKVFVYDATSNALMFCHSPTSTTLQHKLGPISLAKLYPPHLYFTADKGNLRETTGDIIFMHLSSPNSKGLDKIDTKQKIVSHLEVHPSAPLLMTSHNNLLASTGSVHSGSMVRLYSLVGVKGPVAYNVINTSVTSHGKAVISVAFLPTKIVNADSGKGGKSKSKSKKGNKKSSSSLFSNVIIAIAKLKRVAVFDASIPGAPVELYHITPDASLCVVSLMTAANDPYRLWLATSDGKIEAYATDDPLCNATELLQRTVHCDTPSTAFWFCRGVFGSAVEEEFEFRDANATVVEDSLTRNGHSIAVYSSSKEGPMYSKRLRWPSGPLGISMVKHPSLPYVLVSDPDMIAVISCGTNQMHSLPGGRLSNRLLSSSAYMCPREAVVSSFQPPACVFLEPCDDPFVIPPLVAFATLAASTTILCSIVPTLSGATAAPQPMDTDNSSYSAMPSDPADDAKLPYSSLATHGYTCGSFTIPDAAEVHLADVSLMPGEGGALVVAVSYWVRASSGSSTGGSDDVRSLGVKLSRFDKLSPSSKRVSLWKVPQSIVDRCFLPDPDPNAMMTASTMDASSRWDKAANERYRDWMDNQPFLSTPCHDAYFFSTNGRKSNKGTSSTGGAGGVGSPLRTETEKATGGGPFQSLSSSLLLYRPTSTTAGTTGSTGAPGASEYSLWSSLAGMSSPEAVGTTQSELQLILARAFPDDLLYGGSTAVALIPTEDQVSYVAIGASTGMVKVISTRSSSPSTAGHQQQQQTPPPSACYLPKVSEFSPVGVALSRWQPGPASALVDLLAIVTTSNRLMLLAVWRTCRKEQSDDDNSSATSSPDGNRCVDLVYSMPLQVPYQQISSMVMAGPLVLLSESSGTVRAYTPLGHQGEAFLTIPRDSSIVTVLCDRLIVFEPEEGLALAFADAEDKRTRRLSESVASSGGGGSPDKKSKKGGIAGPAVARRGDASAADRGGGSLHHIDVPLFSLLLTSILQLERWTTSKQQLSSSVGSKGGTTTPSAAPISLEHRKMAIIAQLRFLIKHYRWLDATSIALKELRLCGLVNLACALAKCISALVVSSQSLLFHSGIQSGAKWPPTLFETAELYCSNFAEKRKVCETLSGTDGSTMTGGVALEKGYARSVVESLQKQCTAKEVTMLLDSINWYSSTASTGALASGSGSGTSTVSLTPGTNPSFVPASVATLILSTFPKSTIPSALLDSLLLFDATHDAGLDRIRLLHLLYVNSQCTLGRLQHFLSTTNSLSSVVLEGISGRIAAEEEQKSQQRKEVYQQHQAKKNSSGKPKKNNNGVSSASAVTTSRLLLDVPVSQFDLVSAEVTLRENNAGFTMASPRYGNPTSFLLDGSCGAFQSLCVPAVTAHWHSAVGRHAPAAPTTALGSVRSTTTRTGGVSSTGSAIGTQSSYSQSEASFVRRGGRGGTSSTAGSVLGGPGQMAAAETASISVLSVGQPPAIPSEAAVPSAEEAAAVTREQAELRKQYLESYRNRPTPTDDSDDSGGEGTGLSSGNVRIVFKPSGSGEEMPAPPSASSAGLGRPPLTPSEGLAHIGSPSSGISRRRVVAASGEHGVAEYLRKAFAAYDEKNYDSCHSFLKLAEPLLLSNQVEVAHQNKIKQLVHYKLVCNIYQNTSGVMDERTLPLFLHMLQLKLSADHTAKHCAVLLEKLLPLHCFKTATAVLGILKYANGQLPHPAPQHVRTIQHTGQAITALEEEINAGVVALSPFDEGFESNLTSWSLCCGTMQLMDAQMVTYSSVRCSYCDLMFTASYVLERIEDKKAKRASRQSSTSASALDSEGASASSRESSSTNRRHSLGKDTLFAAGGSTRGSDFEDVVAAGSGAQAGEEIEEISCEYCRVGFVSAPLSF